MKRKLSAFLAVFLCFAMCLSLAGAAADTPQSEPSETPSAETAKTHEGAEEVIYGRLDNRGRPRSAYAVVALNVDEAGEVVHYGTYTAVENLTDTSPIEYSGGKVTLTVDEPGRYYYQGTMRKAQMPWDIEISYKLDGQEVDPDDLGGASGKLEVDIHTTTNSGFDAYFTDNYMLQISVTLDSELCEDITTRNGTVANAGSDKTITFVVLPGGEGDVGFAAKVHDFAMSGFTIAAVPYSAASMMGDSEEVDSITDGLTQLSDAIGQLASGAGALSDGAGTLSDNGATLTDASDQIADALRQISDGLQDFNISDMTGDLSQLEQLPAGLTEIAANLDMMSSMMKGISIPTVSGLTDEQTAALAQAVMASGDPTAMGALQSLQGMLGSLSGLAALPGYISQLTTGLDACVDGLMQMAIGVSSGLDGMTDIDTSAITELQTGMAELADNYAEFNDGLKAYADGVTELSDGMGTYASGVYTLNNETKTIPDLLNEFLGTGDEDGEETGPVSFLDERNEETASVQFVLSTEGISAPETDDGNEPAAEPKGFFERLWDKIVALFT